MLELLCAGMDRKTIAPRLDIAYNTVTNRINDMYRSPGQRTKRADCTLCRENEF